MGIRIKQKMNLIQVVRKIGEIGICNENELMFLLPSFPKLIGDFFEYWYNLDTYLKPLLPSNTLVQ